MRERKWYEGNEACDGRRGEGRMQGRTIGLGTSPTYRLLLFLNLPRALIKVALAEKGACTPLFPLPSAVVVVVVVEDGKEAGGGMAFFLLLLVKVEGEDEERGAFGTPSFRGIVGAGVIVVDDVDVVVVVGGRREVVGLRVLDAVEMRPTPPPPVVDEVVPDILACALVDGSDLM